MLGIAFDLTTPTRIVFRAGALRDLGTLAADLGSHALLVTGRSPARAATAMALLEGVSVRATRFPVSGEPTVDTARAGVAAAREVGCDLVIALGGGSALDAGKAIAALVTNGGDPLDYLEVVGRGRPLTRRGLPLIAVPTTAGTGSEVTRNAVLASTEHGAKASLRSPLLLAAIALIDPDLLDGLPAPVLAASGLDALSQLIEPYVSGRANPFTDALARDGIRRSASALRPAYVAARAGTSPSPVQREALALASLFGGLCLANAGLGAVHGFAAPLGGMFDAPHGAVCAALLPHVMRANIRALSDRAPDSPALPRYREAAILLTGREDATAEEGADWVEELVRELEIPGLAKYGLADDAVPGLVEKARAASSMKGNPIALEEDELVGIVSAALD